MIKQPGNNLNIFQLNPHKIFKPICKVFGRIINLRQIGSRSVLEIFLLPLYDNGIIHILNVNSSLYKGQMLPEI